jgi:superoxide dismutase, Fe-Mn family
MTFELPKLPYAQNALEPHISAATVKVHYGKHHRAYVDKANQLVAGTEFERRSLEDVIAATAPQKKYQSLFNNAAQAWNHGFYWNSMSPGAGGEPRGAIAGRLAADFQSFAAFREAFKKAAIEHFGSGWAWLMLDEGRLKIATTANADTPIAHGKTAILTMDVWEHAYYLDYQNQRPSYVEIFLDKLVNWEFAERNYELAMERKVA